MTPTHTGTAPHELPDDSRTHTALYHLDGTQFRGGAPRPGARPVGADEIDPGESTRRGQAREPTMLELAELAATAQPLSTHDVRRLGEYVVELAGQVERHVATARRSNRQALEAVAREDSALERVSDAETRLVLVQRVMRRPAEAVLARAFERATARLSGVKLRALAASLVTAIDDDDDTVIVDMVEGDLADPPQSVLVERWAAATKAVHEAERRLPLGLVPYDLREALDAAEVALARSVDP